ARRTRRQEGQSVRARSADIERAAAELDSVRRYLDLMTHRQQTYLPLERAREVATRTLAAERARLEGEVAERQRCLEEVRLATRQLPELQVQLRRANADAATLAKVEAQHTQLLGVV